MAEQYTDMISEAWQRYYDEIDPVKRVRIYAENIGAEAPDKKRSAIVSMRKMEPAAEIDALRKELFLHRHTGAKGKEMDKVMAAIMSFMHLGRDQGRMAIKEVRSILQGLGFAFVDGQGDEAQGDGNGEVTLSVARELLALELRNGARRYLSCCTGPDYGRAFFGLMAASEARQNDKTTEDIWLATRGIERLVSRSLTEAELDHLQLYENAVISEFYLFHEDAQEWFADYERKH